MDGPLGNAFTWRLWLRNRRREECLFSSTPAQGDSIYTPPVAAKVVKVQPVWDRPRLDFVSVSVRVDVLPFSVF